MVIRTLTRSLLLMLVSTAAFAGATDSARSHFNAIAAGKLDGIMADYASDAVFQWVGGPLDGAYRGTESIKGVWGKFAKANAPLSANISKLEESANPKGSTVTANVVFNGAKTIKVHYALTYRDGRLVNEVWQIDPQLEAAY